MGLDPKEIAITLLFISIFFHYYSYSFTVTAMDYSDYDVSIDIIDLYVSGIMIGEYDEVNVTYEGGLSYMTLNETELRFKWINFPLGVGDALYAQVRSQFFGFPMWIDFSWQNIKGQDFIKNETIVDWWDSDHNWTMIHGLTGYVLFITDPLKEGNITRAVMEDGELTLTLCQDMAWAESPSLGSFISWYVGLVTGSETWGLPENFSIVVRIMTLLGIFSGVFLLSEVRRIVI